MNRPSPMPAGIPPTMIGMTTIETSSWLDEVSPLHRKPRKNSAPQPPHSSIISRPTTTSAPPTNRAVGLGDGSLIGFVLREGRRQGRARWRRAAGLGCDDDDPAHHHRYA